jgi:hypothetical protein
MSSARALDRRTGAMRAVGIINLVIGALAAFNGAAVVVFSLVLAPTMLEKLTPSSGSPQATNDPVLTAATKQFEAAVALAPVLAGSLLVFGVLLMVSGRGLLAMRPWARTMTLCLSWIAIAHAIVTIPLAFMAGATFFRSFDVSVIYWVLAIVLLMSREWREAYTPSPDLPGSPRARSEVFTPPERSFEQFGVQLRIVPANNVGSLRSDFRALRHPRGADSKHHARVTRACPGGQARSRRFPFLEIHPWPTASGRRKNCSPAPSSTSISPRSTRDPSSIRTARWRTRRATSRTRRISTP